MIGIGGQPMNDRYVFRAKRIDNGEWTYGYLYGIWERKYILWGMTNNVPDMTEVDPSTICQCTGLKHFFEKDIVKRTDLHKVGDPSIGIIEYDVENTEFVIHWIDKEKYSPMYPWKDKIKVIGNIFDNPELLQGSI